MDPFVQRSSRRFAATASPAPEHLQHAMRRALRESTYSRDDAKAAAETSSLTIHTNAQEAVARALRDGNGGA